MSICKTRKIKIVSSLIVGASFFAVFVNLAIFTTDTVAKSNSANSGANAPASNVSGAEAKNSTEKAFFTEVTGNALAVLNSKKISRAQKIENISASIRANIDAVFMGRATLGQPWRKITRDEKVKYIKTFNKWVSITIAKRLISLKNISKLEIKKIYTLKNGIVVIRSNIFVGLGINKKTVLFDWYIRRSTKDVKLIDVAIESISMATTQRVEFESIYSRVGISGLIEAMKKQIIKK